MVVPETLLPIILEVGTLGHILLTDKFQLPDFFGNIRLMRFFPSLSYQPHVIMLAGRKEGKDNAQIRKQTLM